MEYALLFLMVIPPLALAACRGQCCKAVGLFDLGLVFAGIVFLYAWLPLLGLILAQHGYGVLQDQRVVDVPPTSPEIIAVGGGYLAFLSGFALIYGWRRKCTPSPVPTVKGDGLQVFIVSAIAVFLILIYYLVRNVLGVGSGESYIDSYTQLRDLPLGVQQTLNILASMGFAASLAAMVFMISWRPRLHRYIGLAVFILLLWATLSGGSRTYGFLLAFAYVICVSIYVRKFKATYVKSLMALGLMLFIFAGVYRADRGFDALMLAPFQGGEFLTLFINSIDLARHAAETGGLDATWQLYWTDVLRLIPQQLLWFEKLAPSVWYVETLYPEFHDAGGGLAFGAIAESVIGFGMTDAFVRGGLLGAAYAFVANRCTGIPLSPLKAFVYIWFVVMSYQAIRDTTFSVFPRFALQVLPLIVLMFVSSSVMRVVLRKVYVEVSTDQKSGA